MGSQKVKMPTIDSDDYDDDDDYDWQVQNDHHYRPRYKMINLVGDGTYGLVYLAYNQESKEKVLQYI